MTIKDLRGEKAAASDTFSEAVPELLESHLGHLLKETGLDLDVVRERKYRSVTGKAELSRLGFASSQQRVPGLLIPLWGVDGKLAGYQLRPDNPRINSSGKAIKYEMPAGSSNRLDCPPRCKIDLGNPKLPLWVTEGSKKADALATHGACAVSVTGVWGFKGKNEFGGTTFLADWDHIALKDRAIYLAFDSDVMTKEPVRQALTRLSTHLELRGGRVQAVILPQDGEAKVGIDDFLLSHTIEAAEKLAADPQFQLPEDNERPVPGFVLSDGTVGEMVVAGDDRYFQVISGGMVKKHYRYQTKRFTFVPTDDSLVGEVVHFASGVSPYESQSLLFKEIQAFIHHYIELPSDFEEIAALYVLLSWVYEFAPSIPYLRVLGDWGSGKTRFLQVVGSVCFRPMFVSGATTPSPVFRILERFKGTLVLDEADFKDSSAWVEMVKVLNNGYRPGFPVLRTDKENGGFYPRSFQVFGPKLIATRFLFKDEALESRCLTAEMMPLTRSDIPRLLPSSFESEVGKLRAKLLTFRLMNLFKLKGKSFGNELLEPNLQPRLQEILIPLKAMLNGDRSMVETLAGFVHRQQASLLSRRRESQVGRVLEAIIELRQENRELSSKNIAKKANAYDEDGPAIAPESVGWMTKRLGLEKNRLAHCGRRIIEWHDERMAQLSAQYGIERPLPPQTPSQPSPPSPLDTNFSGEGFGEGFPGTITPSPDFKAKGDGGEGGEGSPESGGTLEDGKRRT